MNPELDRALMAPMRCLAVAAFVVVMIVGGRAQASSVRLTWTAPPECPAQATVLAEIERLLGKSAPVKEPLEAVAVVDRVDVPNAAPLWRVRIQAGWPGSAPHLRELRGARCGVLAGASALVVAMMIEPLVGGEEPKDLGDRAPAPPPATVAPAPPQLRPAPVAPQPVAPAKPPPSPEPEGRFVIALHAGGAVGALPSVAFGFGGEVGVVIDKFRIDLGMVHYPGSDAELDDERGASVTLTTARLSMAYLPLVDPIEVGPRLGIEIGSIQAEGFGVREPKQGGSAWITPFIGATGAYRIIDYLALRLDVAFGFATIRPTFVLEPYGPVYEVGGPVGFLAGAAEGRF